MTVYVSMQAPTSWPFLTPVVPAHLMPSGNAYRPNASGQIQANQTDVGALVGYGFFLPNTSPPLPSISDNGRLVTISVDGKITGSLDIAEHLHFHESADPGTPNAGGVLYANIADHTLDYKFHDGTKTQLAPAPGGGSGLVLISSGTVTDPVSWLGYPALGITLPSGYQVPLVLRLKDVFLSTADALSVAMSQDDGDSFICDQVNGDSYIYNGWDVGTGGDGTDAGLGFISDVKRLPPLVSFTSGAGAPLVPFLADLEINPGGTDALATIKCSYRCSDSIGAGAANHVYLSGQRTIFLNGDAVTPPTLASVNMLRVLPRGNQTCDPPTSGEMIDAGSWELWGTPL